MDQPAYSLADEPYKFGNARDAIDAMSAFEALILEDYAYEIRAVGAEDFVVEVFEVSRHPTRRASQSPVGFVVPA